MDIAQVRRTRTEVFKSNGRSVGMLEILGKKTSSFFCISSHDSAVVSSLVVLLHCRAWERLSCTAT